MLNHDFTGPCPFPSNVPPREMIMYTYLRAVFCLALTAPALSYLKNSDMKLMYSISARLQMINMIYVQYSSPIYVTAFTPPFLLIMKSSGTSIISVSLHIKRLRFV